MIITRANRRVNSNRFYHNNNREKNPTVRQNAEAAEKKPGVNLKGKANQRKTEIKGKLISTTVTTMVARLGKEKQTSLTCVAR